MAALGGALTMAAVFTGLRLYAPNAGYSPPGAFEAGGTPIYVVLPEPRRAAPEPPPGGIEWFGVWASREGLVGGTTATGHTIADGDVFVALPDRSALGRVVEVWANGRTALAPVWDVGPWSIHDPYWDGGRPPLAERGERSPVSWGAARNPAGIDLSDGLWDSLGLDRGAGLVVVLWRFVD